LAFFYNKGYAVPKNYLCALKWQLKSVEQDARDNTTKNIRVFFEYGFGVPLDKSKALEWYCHSKNKACIDRLKGEDYHRSASDKSRFNYITDSIVLIANNRKTF
jgi:TPR repeat protein